MLLVMMGVTLLRKLLSCSDLTRLLGIHELKTLGGIRRLRLNKLSMVGRLVLRHLIIINPFKPNV